MANLQLEKTRALFSKIRQSRLIIPVGFAGKLINKHSFISSKNAATLVFYVLIAAQRKSKLASLVARQI